MNLWYLYGVISNKSLNQNDTVNASPMLTNTYYFFWIEFKIAIQWWIFNVNCLFFIFSLYLLLLLLLTMGSNEPYLLLYYIYLQQISVTECNVISFCIPIYLHSKHLNLWKLRICLQVAWSDSRFTTQTANWLVQCIDIFNLK